MYVRVGESASICVCERERVCVMERVYVRGMRVDETRDKENFFQGICQELSRTQNRFGEKSPSRE